MGPLKASPSRSLAVVLAGALPLTSPGATGLVLLVAAAARAEPGAPAQPQAGPMGGPQSPASPTPAPSGPRARSLTAAEVLAFLESKGVFKGPEDPLRTYMVENGQVSAMGVAAYRYFQARPQDVKAFEAALSKVRESGPMNEDKAKAIDQALANFKDTFGDIGHGGSAEDVSTLGARLHQLLIGAGEAQPQRASAAPEPGSVPYVQVDKPDGFEFHDKDGLLIKMNKQGVQTWNREIEKRQRLMNQLRPPLAPMIPVSGRYNYEMFQWAHASLQQQVNELEQQYRVDRMARLAELLGKQFREDQWYSDKNLEKKLVEEARKKTFSQLWILNRGPQMDKVCGHAVANYLDLVDCKLKKRVEVLEQLKGKLSWYGGVVDQFKDANTITQDAYNSVLKGETLVRKYVTLSFLEAQRWAADAQLERLEPDAPDHKLIKKSIDDAPLSASEKAAYHGRSKELADRVRRLKAEYAKLEQVLNTAEYSTALERIQGKLAQTQKELGDLGLDYTLYATMPGMLKSARDDSHGVEGTGRLWSEGRYLKAMGNATSGGVNWGWQKISEGLNAGSKKLWGGNLQGEYLRNRGNLATFTPGFEKVSKLVAEGKWLEARQALIDVDPTAIQTHGKDMPLMSQELGEAARAQAVLKKASEAVANVATQHFWVRAAGQLIMWSVAAAIFAPAAGALLSGGSRAMLGGAIALQKGNRAARAGAFFLKAGGEILEHSALRLHALSPHVTKVRSEYALISRLGIRGAPIRLFDAAAKRGIVAGSRLLAFSGMAGTISGGFTGVGHLIQGGKGAVGALKDGEGASAALTQFWEGGDSAFRNPIEATWEGAKQGAQWSLGSGPNSYGWEPLLGLGFGLPSSVFEGRRVVGPLAENLAARGTTGLAAKSIESLSGGRLGWSTALDRGLQSAVKAGGWRGTGATMFGLADNVSKYMLFSHGIGSVAHFASWQLNTQEAQNLERRIKRANQAEMEAMMAPYWLMLPVFPARLEVHSAMASRQQQGYRELQRLGELDLVANSYEGKTIELRGKQETPIIQRIFQFNPWADQGNFGSYTVTKDMKYEAIREMLPAEITGNSGRNPSTGRSVVDPLSVNPLEYLKVARTEPKPGEPAKIGRLHIGDEVRDQAATLFESAISRKPELAAKILEKANFGQKLDGFGYVRPEYAEEVARVLYRTAKEEGLVGGRPLRDPAQAIMGSKGGASENLTSAQRKALVELLPKVQERLQPYLTSESVAQEAATKMLKSVGQVKNPSPQLKETINRLLKRTAEWADSVDIKSPTNKDFKKPWNELVSEFKTDAQWKTAIEKLSPAERDVLASTFEYFDAIHGRFNTFNKVGVTNQRAQEMLQARSLEAHDSGNRPVGKAIDRMMAELKKWAAAEGNGDAAVLGKGAREIPDPASPGKNLNSFEALMGRLDKAIDADKALSAADQAALRGLVEEMKASPWLLHDSKGAALPGWRAGQFEALMNFIAEIQLGGASSVDIIRVFQLLKTGGGKTLLAYEGIGHLADADAAIHGKKLMFLTVLSNLEAQARMEFRAMRKLKTDMQIDTFENFKTKIAQGKTQGKNWADDYWIILDEMDGAALQPALTIGETTAYIPKEHGAFKHMNGGMDRIERLLIGDELVMAQQIRFEANRQSGLVGRIGESNPALADGLKRGLTKLMSLSDRLGSTRGADRSRVRAEVETVLREQKEVLAATEQFKAGSREFGDAQLALSKLSEDLAQVKTQKALGAKVNEIQAQLKIQLKELAQPEIANSAQARSIRSFAESLQEALNVAGQNVGKKGKAGTALGERVDAAHSQLERYLSEQRTTLRAGNSLPTEHLAQFRDAQARIQEAVSGGVQAAPKPKFGLLERFQRRIQGDAKYEQNQVADQVRQVLDQQNNVLWRARWKGDQDAARVREMQAAAKKHEADAARLRKQAARLERSDPEAAKSLKASAEGLEATATRLRSENMQLAEQIKSWTSEAREKRAKAEALRPTNRDEATRLDAEAAHLDVLIQSRKSPELAKGWFKENGEAILREVGEAKPGWEGRVRELTRQRRSVLESAVDAENPIYSIFQRMKDDMHMLYSSKLRTQEDAEMLVAGPNRVDEGAAGAREQLVTKLESLVERFKGRSEPGTPELLARAQELLVKARTEAAQWRDGKPFSKALDAKETPKLKTAREAYQKAFDEVAAADVKLADALKRVKGFTEEAATLRKQAEVQPKQEAALLKRAGEAEAKAKQAEVESEAFRREASMKSGEIDGDFGARKLFRDYLREYEAFLKESLPEMVKSYEAGAVENSAQWAQELKAKGFDADAVRARVMELNSQANKANDPQAAASLRAQASKLQNDLAAIESVLANVKSSPQFWKTEAMRLHMDSAESLRAQYRRIDGVGATELALRYGMKWTGAQWLLSKVPGARNLRVAKPITETTTGLTRNYANELMVEVLKNPFLSPSERWQLFWNLVPSALWPRGLHYHAAAVPYAGLLVKGVDALLGVQPSGETWVRRELFNLARGYTDDPATVRFDNITKKMNAVHNGQWFESMDTPTRRFWELEYGGDLTLPYEHKAIVTMNDFVRDNRKVRIVGLSGTAGPEFRRYLEDGAVTLSGKRLASTGAKDISLNIYETATGKFSAILDAVRATKQEGGLVVLSLPDTRTLKTVEAILLRQGIKQEQIAKVFSDTELLRVNNPEANVGRQTNVHGLKDGTVKVLMLDTRVGGRGLDLNFKGTGSKVFKGYNHMEMLIVDPHNMTQVHNIQAQGRIDLGRVNSGTKRNFHLVIDALTAQKDPIFAEMLMVDPRMAHLKSLPEIRAEARKHGRVEPVWIDIETVVSRYEAARVNEALTVGYRETVREYLTQKQGEVERDQLRSAQVKQDRPRSNPLQRGLDGWAR